MTETLLTTLWPDTLHCRVSLSPQEIDDFHLDLLIVQAWSSADLEVNSILHIAVQDMTEGVSHPHAVYEHQGSGESLGEVFGRQRPLASIASGSTLQTWTTMAQIDTRPLIFARQGVRRLLFTVTMVSKEGLPLGKSHDQIEYDNPSLGYLDAQENLEHLRLQAAQLAGSLIARHPMPLTSDQCSFLRGWLLAHISLSEVSARAKRLFEKSFKRLLKICQVTDVDQIIALGQDMESMSTAGQRQEIVEFCLHLICLSEPISTTALVTLQGIAVLWQIDTAQFSMILERTLSVDRLQDIEPMVLLGITENMSSDQVLKQLNRAYAKWNARITHTDKAIQQQAEDMLSWIAQARGRALAT
jgi:hypothetical protein